MNIITNPIEYTKEFVKYIEEKYNGKYICETSVRGITGIWTNGPAILFYSETPHPEGSNYFGIIEGFRREYKIFNALSVMPETIDAVVANNGDIIYSHYRHHYNISTDGSVWIDGGRDYTRSARCNRVSLKINQDRLEIVSNNIEI